MTVLTFIGVVVGWFIGTLIANFVITLSRKSDIHWPLITVIVLLVASLVWLFFPR